jgi:hypothetical protein
MSSHTCTTRLLTARAKRSQLMLTMVSPFTSVYQAMLISSTVSHACHNGQVPTVECRNPFCVHWETAQDNMGRGQCQAEFKKLGKDGHDASEMECSCTPGVTIPCIAGRAHHTLAEDRDAFLTRFKAIPDELNPIDKRKRTNRFNRCPFEDCNREIIQVNSLGDCFSDANTALLVTHMNVAHGMKMIVP